MILSVFSELSTSLHHLHSYTLQCKALVHLVVVINRSIWFASASPSGGILERSPVVIVALLCVRRSLSLKLLHGGEMQHDHCGLNISFTPFCECQWHRFVSNVSIVDTELIGWDEVWPSPSCTSDNAQKMTHSVLILWFWPQQLNGGTVRSCNKSVNVCLIPFYHTFETLLCSVVSLHQQKCFCALCFYLLERVHRVPLHGSAGTVMPILRELHKLLLKRKIV